MTTNPSTPSTPPPPQPPATAATPQPPQPEQKPAETPQAPNPEQPDKNRVAAFLHKAVQFVQNNVVVSIITTILLLLAISVSSISLLIYSDKMNHVYISSSPEIILCFPTNTVYHNKDMESRLAGFMSDVINLWSANMKTDIAFTIMGHSAAINKFHNSVRSTILVKIADNEVLKNYPGTFSRPIIYAGAIGITLSGTINSIHDNTHLLLGLMNNCSPSTYDYISTLHKSVYISYDNLGKLTKDLQRNAIDMMVIPQEMFEAADTLLGFSAHNRDIFQMGREALYLQFNPHHTATSDLMASFNAFLIQIYHSGRLFAIMEKWNLTHLIRITDQLLK